MYGRRYSGDPYWITARFRSTCSCGTAINKGDTAYYYPRQRKALCEACGRAGESALDDEMLNEALHIR